MMSALSLASARFNKLWILFVNDLLNGDLCKISWIFIFSLFFSFSITILSYTLILPISQLQAQQVMSKIRSHTISQCEQYSSHSVNGDIEIQWEWSNPHPSQNPNPLTDYDKALHNWFRPCTRRTRNPKLCQSAVRERLAKYVKYKASLFYFIFFPDSPTEVTR